MEALFTAVSNCRVSDTIAKESSRHLPDYNNTDDDQDNDGHQPGDSWQLSILVVTTSNYYQITACTHVRYWACYQ